MINGHDSSEVQVWEEPVVYIFEAEHSPLDLLQILTGHRPLVKIGFSTNPIKRFRQIKTACPFPIRAAAIVPADKSYERKLHRAFAGRKSQGEWFEIDGSTLDVFVKTWRANYWTEWHLFVRNITDVIECPEREFSLEEFQALTQYEFEFNNPLDRSLL